MVNKELHLFLSDTKLCCFSRADDGLSGAGGLRTDQSRVDISIIAVNDPVVIGTCDNIIKHISNVSLATQAQYALVKPQRGVAEAVPEECSLGQGWNCTLYPPGCSRITVHMHTAGSQKDMISRGRDQASMGGHARLRTKTGANATSSSNTCRDASNQTYICVAEDEYTSGLGLLVYDPDKHNMVSQQHFFFVSILVNSGTITVAARNLTVLAENSNATYNDTSSIGRMESRLPENASMPSPPNNLSARVQAEATGASVKFFGSLENVNKALQSMQYHPLPNFAGSDTLQAYVHDLDCCSSSASFFQSANNSGASTARRRIGASAENDEYIRQSLFQGGALAMPISITPVEDPLQVKNHTRLRHSNVFAACYVLHEC
jgi:hypothetical protein